MEKWCRDLSREEQGWLLLAGGQMVMFSAEKKELMTSRFSLVSCNTLSSSYCEDLVELLYNRWMAKIGKVHKMQREWTERD